MQLAPHQIHIWSTDLSITPVQEKNLFSFLSPDEKERVHRIRLSTHKQRTIAARGVLRQILAIYLNCAPSELVFTYGEHKKPHLSFPSGANFQFNVAHSDNQAIYALTLKHAVGVDIEKIQPTFNQAIADKYFSAEEIKTLAALPKANQAQAFYQIWARKEAIVKAIGTGLLLPLSSFTVNIDQTKVISLQNSNWSLINLNLFPDFAASLASNAPIEAISYWRMMADGFTMIE